MTVSRSSSNRAASDKSWMNSEISKTKDLGYTLAERKFHFGFVPLMKLWKLRIYQLCLPTPEIKEASPEAMEEEEAAPETENVQHIESAPEPAAPEPQNSVMEETPNQIIVSEASISQPILISLLRIIEQIKTDNAKVNERLDEQDLMFQLILSRLPPPPPHSQNP